eukprot:15340316-Ditylum_brightwellii.AAC.1
MELKCKAMKLKFQQAIRSSIKLTKKNLSSPESFVQFPPHKFLAQAVQDTDEELLKGNPEQNKPWFLMECHYFLPLCKARNHVQANAFNDPIEENKQRL